MQFPGQGWMSHTSPLQPWRHLQASLSHSPWPEQSLKHPPVARREMPVEFVVLVSASRETPMSSRRETRGFTDPCVFLPPAGAVGAVLFLRSTSLPCLLKELAAAMARSAACLASAIFLHKVRCTRLHGCQEIRNSCFFRFQALLQY